jgi:hypothetical protein
MDKQKRTPKHEMLVRDVRVLHATFTKAYKKRHRA